MKDKDPEVWCLGEFVQDWISTRRGTYEQLIASIDDQGSPWIKYSGGAPVNTAIWLAWLGVRAGLLTSVGDDEPADNLRATLAMRANLDPAGVDMRGLVTVQHPTRIAYVLLDEKGDRQFHHFSGDADEHHSPEHLPDCFPGTAKILHLGTLSLGVELAASATLAAIKRAQAAGMIISLDVNYRETLWPDADVFRACVRRAHLDCQIIKMTEDELRIVTGDAKTNRVDLARTFRSENSTPVLLVTLASEGSIIVTGNGAMVIPSIKIESVDSTGAGDAFNAGILKGVLEILSLPENAGRHNVVQRIPLPVWQQIVERANALGAKACTRPGAWPPVTTAEELTRFPAGLD